MSNASVAVGTEKPPYFGVFLHVLTFLCGAFLPRICTTTSRSLAVFSVAPISILFLSIRIRQGIDSPTAFYVTVVVLGVLIAGILAFMALAISTTQSHLAHRKSANPSARAIVQQGMERKRILRTKKYDIYLPPPALQPSTSSAQPYAVAFFMLPGALVEHNAYAAMMTQLSDAGILVVIQNCEPIRIASEAHCSAEEDVRSLISQIEQKHGITATRWAIGGHSMGGYTAMMIAKKSDFFCSLVMYGVNKNYEMEKTSIRALAITASNDGLQHSSMADISTFGVWGEGDTKGRLFHVVIQGGNHGGFADYPRQTFPLPDGERSISLQEQHRQAVQATVEFLMPKQE